jgi:hypothetical protein
VAQDFHGERAAAAAGESVEESYDKVDRQGADGTFTAPFAGIHGWYWENPERRPGHCAADYVGLLFRRVRDPIRPHPHSPDSARPGYLDARGQPGCRPAVDWRTA